MSGKRFEHNISDFAIMLEVLEDFVNHHHRFKKKSFSVRQVTLECFVMSRHNVVIMIIKGLCDLPQCLGNIDANVTLFKFLLFYPIIILMWI